MSIPTSRRTMASAIASALLTTYLLTACGGGGGNDTPTPTPTPTPAGSAAECLNPAANLPGTTIRLVFRIQGVGSGSVVMDNLVKPITTFDGQTGVREIDSRVSMDTTIPGSGRVQSETSTQYFGRQTTTSVIDYGKVEVDLGDPSLGSSRTVYRPARSDARAGLALGASLSVSVGTEVLTTFPNGSTSTASTPANTETIVYRGQETVTVPAGSYRACRFDVTKSDAQGRQIEWIGVGNGMPIKTSFGVDTPTEGAFELMPGSLLNGNPF